MYRVSINNESDVHEILRQAKGADQVTLVDCQTDYEHLAYSLRCRDLRIQGAPVPSPNLFLFGRFRRLELINVGLSDQDLPVLRQTLRRGRLSALNVSRNRFSERGRGELLEAFCRGPLHGFQCKGEGALLTLPESFWVAQRE